MRLYDLRTEYQKDPIGLNCRRPRFSWKIETEERNTLQKSYRIQVSLDEKKVWDSGKVESQESVLIAYSGEELLPETIYRVHLSVEDNHGNRAEGEMQFETGIFSTQDFQAEMITHDFPDEETACPVFERTFAISKKVRRARVFATAQGVYELALNGCRIGADRMTPGWTSYHHRLQYQIYDITEHLKEENRLEMTVANGWYKGILGFYCQPNIYGNRVGAFAEIHLFYEDGSREVIATDESWTVRTGEIRYSEIYMGETIDTENPSIIEGRVLIKEFNKAVLTAQENEPVRITERIPAKALIETKKGEHVVDFGQNLTGLVELKIHGKKGQKIQIRHAEVLDKDGNFYPDTLREAKSVDIYICNGKEQVFLPHFTFHGFRYIAVEGIEEMKLEQFTACVMHSDMEKTGDFVCSNDKVCQLQSNIAWGQRGNFLDIPTDCPQRDERLGWMGDAGVFSWTAAFNRNTALFFTKWMRDIAAESSAEKGVPQVVPDIIGQYSASVWSDAAVIIPWVVYQTYGDKRILEESWKCMHEWIDYITRQCGKKGLWLTGFQYGDWLALDAERCREISEGATDKYMIANAYYLYVTDLVRQTAEALGKEEDAKKYKDLYERTLLAFRQEYYTPAGRSVSETQTGSALSLRFNLVYEKDREGITETLVRNIQEHKNHLCTGFVGTPHLCHALSENGAHEIAATIFMKEDYPSWLYAVNMGATTVWERWDAIQPDGTMEGAGLNSMNHYAYGSIGDWMYRKIAGLSQVEPGYKKFRIQPMFVTGIEEAGVELESVYGKIESHWSCKNGKIAVKVVVPPNTTAEICLPEKEEIFEVGSGRYEYVYDTETCLAVRRFSLDSKFGELLADPLGAKLLNEMIPEIVNNPMIEYIKNMTVTETLGMTPDRKSDYMEVLRKLNKQ